MKLLIYRWSPPCPWDVETFQTAALEGHLEVLNILSQRYAELYPWINHMR